jgi:two-component system nitrogen regulation response regulator NtrX
MAQDILIVDDEADIRELIGGLLEDEGYQARYAAEADGALAAIMARKPALAILDVWLQGSRLDGIELLDEIKQADPDLPIIVISGHGTIETAVAAIRKGAYDFIEKPFKSDKLLVTVERALETSRLRRENAELRSKSEVFSELVGESAAAIALRNMIEKVAPTNSRVLISGPPGSGKELVARMIHAQSLRADGPFVPVSAAMMNPDRVEDELFGSETRWPCRSRRALGTGPWRHAFPGRGRRHAHRHPGQASAHAGGTALQASGRRLRCGGECARSLLKRARLAQSDRPGPLP